MASVAYRCAAEHRLRITDVVYKNEQQDYNFNWCFVGSRHWGVLRRIIGHKREEVTGGYRKLIRNSIILLSIIRLIKMRMKYATHIAWIGQMRNPFWFWYDTLKGRHNLEILSVDEMLTLMLEIQDVRMWTEVILFTS
jgi:hypothetical protein